MKEFQKIKDTGSSMFSVESSDRQEFGSFYLSRFLDLKSHILMKLAL